MKLTDTVVRKVKPQAKPTVCQIQVKIMAKLMIRFNSEQVTQ
jgi:hypothetical protein